jgi:hypothetical protein
MLIILCNSSEQEIIIGRPAGSPFFSFPTILGANAGIFQRPIPTNMVIDNDPTGLFSRPIPTNMVIDNDPTGLFSGKQTVLEFPQIDAPFVDG